MVDTRFSLMLIGLLLIGFVTCDRCTSNVAFKDDIKDFKVISVNTTTCYEVNSMKALDGCGVAKGRLTILSIEIQPVSYRKITDLRIRLFGYPKSLNGVGVPFPLSTEMANPCLTQINCPFDKNNRQIQKFDIAVPLDGVLSLIIPKGEDVIIVVELYGVDMLTNEEENLGTLNEMNFSILEEDNELVLRDEQKIVEKGSECNDRVFEKLPVEDFSSRRVNFREMENGMDFVLLKFHVIEDFDRKSFGKPELSMKIDGDKVFIPEKYKYPCGRTTCKFEQISKHENKVNRLYSIKIPKVILNQISGEILTIKLQGAKKRAYAEIQMSLDHFLGEKQAMKTKDSQQKIIRKMKTPGSAREKRWNYDINEYNNHINQKIKQNQVFSSSGMINSLFISSRS